jgi:hypothetical protein
MRRVNEIIGRVVGAGLMNKWISLHIHTKKLHSRKIALVHQLHGYYSFNLCHMQPAFYLLSMGCVCHLLYVRDIVQLYIVQKDFKINRSEFLRNF